MRGAIGTGASVRDIDRDWVFFVFDSGATLSSSVAAARAFDDFGRWTVTMQFRYHRSIIGSSRDVTITGSDPLERAGTLSVGSSGAGHAAINGG